MQISHKGHIPVLLPLLLIGVEGEIHSAHLQGKGVCSPVGKEGGAASACEKKKNKNQKGEHTKHHFWLAAALCSLRKKGLGFMQLPKRVLRLNIARDCTYISHLGVLKDSQKPCPVVLSPVCPRSSHARPSADPRLPGQDNQIFASGKETLCEHTERQGLLSVNQ